MLPLPPAAARFAASIDLVCAHKGEFEGHVGSMQRYFARWRYVNNRQIMITLISDSFFACLPAVLHVACPSRCSLSAVWPTASVCCRLLLLYRSSSDVGGTFLATSPSRARPSPPLQPRVEKERHRKPAPPQIFMWATQMPMRTDSKVSRIYVSLQYSVQRILGRACVLPPSQRYASCTTKADRI